MSTTSISAQLATINGIRAEIVRGGRGGTVVFLHPGLGLFGAGVFLDMLAKQFDVVAPSHPGFGRSELPDWMSQVDDLAYFHLDLLRELDLRDVVLVGSSFGGWIAAEMAVKSTERISHLVLVDALGIKVGDRESRDIADVHSLKRSEVERLSFADPKNRPNVLEMTDEDLAILARNRESEALFGWAPYMHNPKLLRRLHRIRIPTSVVWGEQDRIVSPDYGRAYAAAIPGATFAVIGNAAHYPHLEQPRLLAQQLGKLAPEAAPYRATA